MKIAYWSQPSSVVLCIQNCDFRVRITGLYGSQPSFVAFACKTATLGPELQVSISPRPHLWFFAFKTAPLAPELQVSMGPSPHLWFCAYTTSILWPELIVSMGPRPHWSFWACKTSWLASEKLVSMGPSPNLCFFACKTASLRQELQDSMGPRPHLWFFAFKSAPLAPELQVSMGSSPHLLFCAFTTVRYKAISNSVRQMTRQDHQAHVEEMAAGLEKSTNQRPFWSWLKKMRKSDDGIPQLYYNNKVHSSNDEKAEALNQYFQSVFTKEATGNLQRIKTSLSGEQSPQLFDFITFSEEEVCDELCKIDVRKASGPDGVHGRLLKEAAPFIANSLAKLFAKSLATGCIPQDWKVANVTPVHKKGSRHLPGNYRPISLTSLVGKIMERIVARKMRAFLEEHISLSQLQHEFRPRHSCLTQLLETVHQWAATLDKGKSIHAVFLDFAKAFESVPHQRLLIKRDHIGVRGQVLKWVESFLTGRLQRVVVNGHSSSWAPVTSGVPQGSVLGPLLFIIFINDIMDNVSSTGGLFADDCVIYREVSHRRDAEELQRDLEKISEWTKTWQLSLNIKKCKVMEITNRKITVDFEYCLTGTNLDWVDSFRYLGLLIDTKLRWNNHCCNIAAKATRILNLLKRSMSGCSQRAKQLVFRLLSAHT